MKIWAFFSDEGAPKTGLSPVIDLWTNADTPVNIVVDGAFTEAGDGWYFYDHTIVRGTGYVYTIDGSASLSKRDRYKNGGINEAL